MDRMLMQAFITGMVVGAILMALLIGAIWVVVRYENGPLAHDQTMPHWSP